MNPRRLASATRVVAARRYGRFFAGAALVLGPIVGNAASLTPLGDLPGGSFESKATGVSADGKTVVGNSKSANGSEAFRWTAADGMTGLGDLPGGIFESTATGASADGRTIVGTGKSANGDEAFRWTSTDGMTGLGHLSGAGSFSQANGVSRDGRTVVGSSSSTNGYEAFRWTPLGGMKPFRNLPVGQAGSGANAISGDGTFVVGRHNSAKGIEAFRWTTDGDVIALGYLPGRGTKSEATGVSADGGVVVGTGIFINGEQAFRWTTATGLVGIGDLQRGIFGSQATGVSGDGEVVVGIGNSEKGLEAFVWTAATGLVSLQSLLQAKKIDPLGDDWSVLTAATAISSDGRYVVGYGTHKGNTEGFLADLLGEGPPPPVQASLTPLGDLPGGAYRSEFGALSADGRTVVGWSYSTNGKEAFRWSLAGGMNGLGDLPGGAFESTATAVSADGSVVAGSSLSANGTEAFRWTAAGGIVGLGDLPGGSFSSAATGISADGSVVVGNGVSTNGNDVFSWTAAGGLTGLAGITGSKDYGSTQVTAVSDDGNVVVGGVVFSPYRWTVSGSGLWFGQGLPGGPWPNLATAVSADGNTVVGRIGASRASYPEFAYEAFRVSFAGGTAVAARLGLLDGYISSEAYAVSADGSTVVGNVANVVRFAGVQVGPAFRWTAATGMTSLGLLPGNTGGCTATSVSADGNVVVGYGLTSSGLKTFVWTAATGMKSMEAVLLSRGVDPASDGWTAFAIVYPETATVSSTVISRDGRFVAGTGIRNFKTEAYLADIGIPMPPLVTATFAGGAVTLRWNPTFSAVQQVQRAVRPEGPYTQVAAGALAGTYTETPPAGAGQYYRVIWP